MAEIKVGDWVRLKPNQSRFEIEYDKIYKVNRIVNRPNGDLLYVHPTNPDYGLFANRFELVRSAEEGFKVGDVISWNHSFGSGNWHNVTINNVKSPDYATGYGEDGMLGGFYFKDIVLISVAEEKKIVSSDGNLGIITDEHGNFAKIVMKGDKFVVDDRNESHELTVNEAREIADAIIVSLTDVIDVYEALIKNGFVIKKVG